MKVATLGGLLLVLIAAGSFVSLAYHQDDDDDTGACTKECFPDSILECPSFIDLDHCQNCCTIKPSTCLIRYNNGTVACEGEGTQVCLQYCELNTVVQCGDVIYTDRCENCCTVQFTNCAIRHAGNGTIICQGIGFDPWGRDNVSKIHEVA